MIFNDFSSLLVTSAAFAFYYAFTLFIAGLGFYAVEFHLLFFVKSKAQNRGGLVRQKITAKFFHSLENFISWFAPRQYEKIFPPGFYKITKFKTLCFFIVLSYLYPGWYRLLIDNLPNYSLIENLYHSASGIYNFLEIHLKTISLTLGALAISALIFSRPLYKFRVKYSAKRETDKSNFAKAYLAHRKINKNLRPLGFNFEKNIEIFYRQTKDVKLFIEQLQEERNRFNLVFLPSPFERLCDEYRSAAEPINNLLEIDKQIEEDCVEDEFFELSKNFRRELFCLGFGRIGERESLEATFLDQAYIRNLFQSWKENIIENRFDDSQAERDIKWRIELLLSEALEERISLNKLIKKQHKQTADDLLTRIAAALPG